MCLESQGADHTNGQNAFFSYFLFVFLKSLIGDIKEWPNEQNDKERCVCSVFVTHSKKLNVVLKTNFFILFKKKTLLSKIIE